MKQTTPKPQTAPGPQARRPQTGNPSATVSYQDFMLNEIVIVGRHGKPQEEVQVGFWGHIDSLQLVSVTDQ